ncbi:hypothetical protein [Cellulomonas phragmiteti]|uniref:Uncharacterized protein n=1 Tax=Cellulomonas phragmiteti TaxID=478780 RepID=A0ABQ4DP14_9CELL|nr:hypothetical protein [Cellulomonas phragmiteti]GIG41084.1 hypothetical protein Cph01nite_28460 [Cellulomonas phragmiteti]
MSALGDLVARLLGRTPRHVVVLEEDPVPTAEQIATAVRDVEASIEGRVPAAVTARVHRITGTVEDMVPRLDRFGVGDRQAYTVVATATSYLPEAVEGYLRLPRDFADRRVVSRGKTSLMLLCDQLDLLAVTLEKISDAVYRADAQALVAHGQFLAEKFGQSSLDVPGTGAP